MDGFLCIKDCQNFNEGETYFGEIESDESLSVNTDFYDDDYGEWYNFEPSIWRKFFKEVT